MGGKRKGGEGRGREGKRTSKRSPSSKFATTPLVAMSALAELDKKCEFSSFFRTLQHLVLSLQSPESCERASA